MSLVGRINKCAESALSFLKQPFHLLCMMVWGAVLLGYWRGINNKIPFLKEFTDELEWGIVLVTLILSIKQICYRLKASDLFFGVGCLLIYLLNFVLYPDNQVALEQNFFQFAILALPFYFYGAVLDINTFLKPLFYISIVSITICFCYELIYLQGGGGSPDADTTNYNMSLSYNMLQHTLLVSWITLKEMKLWQFPFMLLGVFLLLALGTRGPILCLIIFITTYVLFFKRTRYKYTIRIVAVGLALVFVKYIEQIALFLQTLMIQVGMSTRILDKYLTEEIGESSGRNSIKELLYRVLNQDTSDFGFGLCGSYKYVNTYPHNLFLEFWFSFGWLVGSVLLSLLLFLIVKTAITCRHSINHLVFLSLLICGSIVKLLLSGSFLHDALFFLLIGFCFNILRHKNCLTI